MIQINCQIIKFQLPENDLGQKKSPELFYFSKGKTSAAEITPQTRDSKTGVHGIQPSACTYLNTIL
jgi:hypothetical protein